MTLGADGRQVCGIDLLDLELQSEQCQYLHRAPIDMRKGRNALASSAQEGIEGRSIQRRSVCLLLSKLTEADVGMPSSGHSGDGAGVVSFQITVIGFSSVQDSNSTGPQ